MVGVAGATGYGVGAVPPVGRTGCEEKYGGEEEG